MAMQMIDEYFVETLTKIMPFDAIRLTHSARKMRILITAQARANVETIVNSTRPTGLTSESSAILKVKKFQQQKVPKKNNPSKYIIKGF